MEYLIKIIYCLNTYAMLYKRDLSPHLKESFYESLGLFLIVANIFSKPMVIEKKVRSVSSHSKHRQI